MWMLLSMLKWACVLLSNSVRKQNVDADIVSAQDILNVMLGIAGLKHVVLAGGFAATCGNL